MRAAAESLGSAARVLAGKGPFVSAHRGFSSAAPENTLPALAAAFASGADVAEIDVRLTADGVLVVIHDRFLDRTTNGSGPISATNFADLKQLDAGSWFSRDFARVGVPTLAEVFDWSRDKLPLIVELKTFPERDPRFLERFVEVVEATGSQSAVIPSCFDHVILRDLNQVRPSWPLQMILPCRLADPVHAAASARARMVSLEPEFVVLEDVTAFHKPGVAVLTTLSSPDQAKTLTELGVDFLESDDVDMVRDALRMPDLQR
jgi:glycerophosphoryl diester phosphodiesterase